MEYTPTKGAVHRSMEKGQQLVWLTVRFPYEKNDTGREHSRTQTSKPESEYARKRPGNRYAVNCFLSRLLSFNLLICFFNEYSLNCRYNFPKIIQPENSLNYSNDNTN